MVRRYVGLTTIAIFLFLSILIPFQGAAGAPALVTTQAASGVTLTAATLHGNVAQLTPGGTANVSFQWGLSNEETSANETLATLITADNQGSMDFSDSLSGLSPGTTYYFRAKAATQNDTAYGAWLSFPTLSANPTYTLTITAGSGGNVTAPGIGTFGLYSAGQAVNLVASANPNYHFVNWTGQVSTIANPTLATTNITMNGTYTIQANFAIDTYTIATSAGSNGTITPSGSVPVNYGASQTFTITPNTAYHVSGVTVDNVSIGTPTSFTFTNVTSNHAIAASFAVDTYTLTINATSGGSVTSPGTGPNGPYGAGQLVTIVAAPNTNYQFVNWTGQVSTIANPALATTNITMNGNYTIQANFTSTPDATPPAAVSSLATGNPTSSSITLTWTAPGDDGNTGTPSTYDIRYSTSTIDAGNWSSATQAAGPTPQPAGTQQTLVVNVLSAGTRYYFSMKSADEVPNWSGISNVASATTTAAQPPPPVGGFGGGGGGGVPAGPGVTSLVAYTSDDGIFNIPATVKSEDGNLQINIAKGVQARTKDGSPLRSISAAKAIEAAQPPADSVFVASAYDLGPDGATFGPPISIEFSYDRSLLPPGIPEKAMTIVEWNPSSSKWVEVASSVDVAAARISASVSHFSRYSVTVLARPALFAINSLSISPSETMIGNTISVGIHVSNQGDLTGTYSTVLKVDGKNHSNQDVTLAGNSAQQVSFKITLTAPGQHEVDVNGITGRFTLSTAATPSPAALSTSISVSPAEVFIGENTVVTVLVKNTGGLPGTRPVVVSIEGRQLFAGTVEVPAHSEKTIQIPAPGGVAGVFTVEVDGRTSSYTVKGAPIAAANNINWWLVGLAVASVTATAFVATVRRRGKPAEVPATAPQVKD